MLSIIIKSSISSIYVCLHFGEKQQGLWLEICYRETPSKSEMADEEKKAPRSNGSDIDLINKSYVYSFTGLMVVNDNKPDPHGCIEGWSSFLIMILLFHQ